MNSKIYNVVILDKSGSMTSIRKQAVDSVNETFGCIRSMRKKNAEQEQFVTLVAFCGCEQKVIYENTPIEKVNDITLADYEPCCMTPLYDAIGNVCTRLHTTIKDDASASVAVTIITDGYENASREYSLGNVKKLIEDTSAEGWVYTFMAANIDEHAVARDLSIKNVDSFRSDSEDFCKKSATWNRSRKAFYSKRALGKDVSSNFFDDNYE